MCKKARAHVIQNKTLKKSGTTTWLNLIFILVYKKNRITKTLFQISPKSKYQNKTPVMDILTMK